MRNHFGIKGTTLALSLLVLAGCSGQAKPPAGPAPTGSTPTQSTPTPTEQEQLATLYDAAKKEGELVLYTGFPEKEANEMLATFAKKYPGIKGTLFRGTGTQVAQRFETESRAGRHEADLIAAGAMPQMPKWREQGLLAPLGVSNTANYPANAKDKDGYWAWAAVSSYGIMYNTAQVKPEEAPKVWTDVMDPKWKGKVAMVAPWVADTPLEWAFFMENELKVSDAAQKMAALEPMLATVGANAAQPVVSGERSVALVQDWVYVALKKQSAPVAFVFPSDGSSITPRPIVLASKAPHPNAAKLFVHWLFSEEGQSFVVDVMGYYSVRPGQKPPVGMPEYSSVKGSLVESEALAKVSANINQRWKAAFGQ